MDGSEFFSHHQPVGIVETLAAEFGGLVETEKAERAEFSEQIVRGEASLLLPGVEVRVDFGSNESLQRSTRLLMLGGEDHLAAPL